MKRLLIVLALLSVPAWATDAVKQVIIAPNLGGGDYCAQNLNWCVVDLVSLGGQVTTAGSAIVAPMAIRGVTQGSATLGVVVTCYILDGNGRCTGGNIIDTLTNPGTCAIYHNPFAMDAEYILAGAGGARFVDFTKNDSTTLYRWFPGVVEVTYTTGPIVVTGGGCATQYDPNVQTQHSGIAFTLTGDTNDFIVQWADLGPAQTSITPSCYGAYWQGADHAALSVCPNTTDGSYPTWIGAAGSGVVAGIAFKETGAPAPKGAATPGAMFAKSRGQSAPSGAGQQ